MIRRLATALSTCLLAAALLGASAAPASAALRSCSLAGKQRSLGPTYVTSLKRSGTSCATAYRLVRAYYRCRVDNGGKDGTCRRRVLRFRCSERRFNKISTQYDARVDCRRGSARVVHTYTQFT